MVNDKIDEKIIEFLRNDARESFVEIGKKLKLSESAVRRRVKNLVDGGVIEKFTVEMGEANTTSAIVLISVDSSTDTSKVSTKLTKLEAVISSNKKPYGLIKKWSSAPGTFAEIWVKIKSSHPKYGTVL